MRKVTNHSQTVASGFTALVVLLQLLVVFRVTAFRTGTEIFAPSSGSKVLSRLTSFTTCPRPKSFPHGIQLETRRFQNHVRDIKIPAILVATPRNPIDILKITNWAYQKGYRVRALGGNHNFSPLLVPPTNKGLRCPNIILVETTQHLTSMKMNHPDESGLPSVSVETGAKLLHLLEFVEGYGYGIYASPTIGSVSVGGMLATGTHGSGVPFATLDQKSPGHTYGTLSNLIIDMTIVAWDTKSEKYILKNIHRSDKDCKAFLVHLGRTFVTNVTLRLGKDQKLRTENHFFVRASEFYQNPDQASDTSQTMSKFVNTYGRIDAVSLATSHFVWLITWHSEPRKPPTSRLVLYPFNYMFMNYVPNVFDHLSQLILSRVPSLARLIGTLGYVGGWIAVNLTWARDYWGASKNHILYASEFTPHIQISGFTFLTSRDNLQRVVWIIKTIYDSLENEYGKQNLYPIAGGIDFRVTGLDDPADVGIPDAEGPSISAARKNEHHPEYNLVIWVDIGSILGTSKRLEFLTKFQSTLLTEIDGKYAIVRPEWSKEWAFSEDSSFNNETIFSRFSKIYPNQANDGWNWTVSTWDKYDPHSVFSNDFLDKLVNI